MSTCPWLLKTGPRKGQPCGKSATYPPSNPIYCGKHKKTIDYLSNQPSHIIQNIGQYLNPKSRASFALTSQRMYRQMKEPLQIAKMNQPLIRDALSRKRIYQDTYTTKEIHKIFEIVDELPNCKYLDCNNMEITKLPRLPICESLSCDRNQLTELPPLPMCQKLLCENNPNLYYDHVIAKRFNLPFPSPRQL